MLSTRHAALLIPLLASGCLVGPTYRRPSTPMTPAYKEAGGWAPVQPANAADRIDWWTAFGDPVLDNLEGRIEASNQSLAAAEAAYREAHALVAEDRAALFPTLTANGSANASGGGGGRGAPGSTSGGTTTAKGTQTVYQVSLGASWVPDLWGAVRRNIRSAKANAQASAALVAGARLTAETELAADYISLRELDQEKRDFDANIAAYQRTLTIVTNKYAAGNAPRSDVLSAQSQLESARAADTDLIQQRARMEHAIAILVGQAPAQLTLPPGPWSLTPPQIPAGVPSTLLQRRPDIANAERTAASRSELIGVAVAAFFPTLSLTGDGGFSAANIGKLFNVSSSFWSVGAQVAETIFNGGARSARVREARAAYDQAVANYRQTVLTAFGQVEDNLAAQKVFLTEEGQLRAAHDDARASLAITLNEYRAGTVDYTTVDTAQVAADQSENALVQMQANRLTTAVSLIEALGGGFTTAALPKS
ncbi:MAG TPA: efflux transporter outer membrane subunit [Caulobacteraceae bacterium]|nr:efflux transporter outer membrane subunit [Caulobacteraceae bacterium]